MRNFRWTNRLWWNTPTRKPSAFHDPSGAPTRHDIESIIYRLRESIVIDESLPIEAAADPSPFADSTSMIQYVEVWTPASDGQHLHLSAACRLGHSKLLITPKATTVARGEGVAGRAWNQNSASIVQECPSELIDHYCEQSGEKLVALVAVPIFCQTDLRGVVVLGLGHGYGAAELWTRDDRDELSVSMSYYRGLKSLEFINQYVRFPKGGGFPGKIWKSGLPRLAGNLHSDADVVSTFDHDHADLTAAVGLPIGSSGGFASCVLMLLSASQSPLAKVVEHWQCESQTQKENKDEEPVTTITITDINVVQFTEPAEHQVPPDSVNDWRKPVCDRIAKDGLPLLISHREQALPPEFEFALTIPTYRVQKLVGIMIFLF